MTNHKASSQPDEVGEMVIANPRMPMNSSARPNRATNRGLRLIAIIAALGAAMNAPSAKVASNEPAPSELQPRTLCMKSGNENRMPNSPRLTISAAKLPSPKVLILKSRKSMSALCPRLVRKVSY